MKDQTDNLISFNQSEQALSGSREKANQRHKAFLEENLQNVIKQKRFILQKLALTSKGSAAGPQEKTSKDSQRVDRQTTKDPSEPQFTLEQIKEFATGSLAKCFGDHYSMYDHKKAPRTPNGDLLLMSRIMDVQGQKGAFQEGASLISEYDVPADAWYYRQNSAPVMPYSILMEIALQPCGFLATFMGCTLIYPELDLCFRNLDSHAVLLKDVDPRNRTITAKSKLTSVASSAETVIVQFDYELLLEGTTFFKGDTAFGYFTPTALINQVGLDRGELTNPWFKNNIQSLSNAVQVDIHASKNRKAYFSPSPGKPFFFQPAGQLNFLDSVLICEKGGVYGKGYIYGEKAVDPSDWFFPFHFFQDPVMPGSLGVEAILQCMRMFAIQQNLGAQFTSPCFSNATNQVVWKYRGQIIQSNKVMSLEAHIKEIDKQADRIVIIADAGLWKDGLRIYEVKNAAVSIIEASGNP